MTKIQDFKMYINGEWVDSSSGKKIETLNPENNEVWATVPEANEKDVDKAVQSAQKAFENNWSTLHPRERAKYLKLIADQLRANSDYYFLTLSIIFSIVGISSWWLTFKKT